MVECCSLVVVYERGSEALFIGGGGGCAMEYSPFTLPKLTSFWRLGTLNQATHPATDLGDVAAIGTQRPGPFGGYGPLRTIFCDDVDLFISFPWMGGWPKTESRCILGVHFTGACSCSSRWIWTEFWASTAWVLCWAF
jgi:hypothetical protein